MRKGRFTPVSRGLTATFLSIAMLSTLGYQLADKWRGAVDDALGTSSYITSSKDAKYKSSYTDANDLMAAAKRIAVREGEEGTVIMKNENGVLPLASKKVALFGGASYCPYQIGAGNADSIDLVKALEAQGYELDATMKGIYQNILSEYTEVNKWGNITRTYTYGPNFSAGDYTDFKVREVNPSKFTQAELGNASEDWEDKVHGDIGIVTIARPGGEGTTYKPGSALDWDGNPTGKDPLELSDDELAVIDLAKRKCNKVVVLLNVSCAFEVDPLVKGEHAVDGIAYIGCPNDYQFEGIVNVLSGKVNASGALTDTYAVSSTSSPAMVNFGGDYFADYLSVSAGYDDPRYPGVEIGNFRQSSFDRGATYNSGHYINEVEGIYTGYSYYETRYYDAVANASSKANSAKGSINGAAWDYDNEVNYPFGYGLSYLPYETKLNEVSVEVKNNGKIRAKITVTNKGDKAGLFNAPLYAQTPYTAYDKTNKVEKSAIQFLTTAKVEVEAGASKTVELEIPTKYIASYDYTAAKTYIFDAGDYYFATGNGSHDALKNIMAAQGISGITGDVGRTGKFVQTGDTDTTTFAVSESGGKITNVAEDVDMNHYLPGSTTYLSRSDWDATWPIDYNHAYDGKGLTIANSPIKDEWMTHLRNQDYMVKTDDPVKNMNGVAGPKFNAESITYDIQTDISNQYWDDLANAIPAEEALGAIAHGGSQSDVLTNIDNPVVKQADGPTGFTGKTLSANNLENKEDDEYWVDPESDAGKFHANVNSQTLMGTSFDPQLAEDWGEVLGNTALWVRSYQIWAAALNYHRTPYNGRNNEYLSEDPMLSNILGVGLLKGTNKYGLLVGPKHIGFNDQEYNRAGVGVYMNEQKFRETDLKGFQGAVEEAHCLGLMVAFNRLGATNASHHVGFLKNLVRGEWGFKGLISTDMMSNNYYFNPESCAMATVTQMADFAGDNSHLNLGTGGVDATWAYLSPDAIKNDNALVEASRECMKYQLYAFANTAVLNISTERVTPSWETALKAITITSFVLGGAGACWWLACVVLDKPAEKKEEESK